VDEYQRDGTSGHIDEVFPYRLRRLYCKRALHEERRKESQEAESEAP
jgi:hypothetical protein